MSESRQSRIDWTLRVRDLIASLSPGAQIEEVERFAPDEAEHDQTTEKVAGYGEPVRIAFTSSSGEHRELVLHTASGDFFGHDRRSDRAQQMLLSFDSFGEIPNHVRAIDVGVIEPDGRLRSVAGSGEFYLLTEYVEGTLYADDLRRIARERSLDSRDRERCDMLARYLVDLHRDRGGRPEIYARAIRDLVGHGEGVFGIVDGYPPDRHGVSLDRLRAIEASCVDWRWRLRGREDRLTRTHGDFHPFNILFRPNGQLTLLDASRGCRGDAADDVACLALNYAFFALDHEGAWAGGLRELWYRFWRTYIDGSGDREILEVVPPFLAWRALVLANPAWYPTMSPESRDAILSLAERTLGAGRLSVDSAEELFD